MFIKHNLVFIDELCALLEVCGPRLNRAFFSFLVTENQNVANQKSPHVR